MVEEKKSSTIKKITPKKVVMKKEEEKPKEIKVVNIRVGAPIYSDIDKCKVMPGQECKLSPELAKSFTDKGYVKTV